MTDQERELFAEEILRRMAALAYEEQRPHLLRYLSRTSAAPATATPKGGHGDVVDLAARRRHRAA